MALHIIDNVLSGQHEKHIAPLLLAGVAAGGFIKSGGLAGIIGSKKRRKEEEAARVEQRERQYEYENFDYNQDVGAINNPFNEVVKQRQEFDQENIDQSQANVLDQHKRAGVFGATTGIQAQSARETRRSGQDIAGLRAQGAQYVEGQRQSRISDRYQQAGTFLARADERLAAAKRARTKATESIFKGIGGAVTAAAGGIAGGAGQGIGGALKSSGLVPDFNPGAVAGGGGGFAQKFQQLAGGASRAIQQGSSAITPRAGASSNITNSGGFLPSIKGTGLGANTGRRSGGGLVGSVEVGQGAFGGIFDQGDFRPYP